MAGQGLELSPRHEQAKQLLQRARMKARTNPLRASHDILLLPSAVPQPRSVPPPCPTVFPGPQPGLGHIHTGFGAGTCVRAGVRGRGLSLIPGMCPAPSQRGVREVFGS